MKPDQATIQALLDAGFVLLYRFDVPIGNGYISLDEAADIADMLHYGAESYAAYPDSCESLEHYREWVATKGIPLCGAPCCDNPVHPEPLIAPHWLQLHRVELCSKHSK